MKPIYIGSVAIWESFNHSIASAFVRTPFCPFLPNDDDIHLLTVTSGGGILGIHVDDKMVSAAWVDDLDEDELLEYYSSILSIEN